MLTKFYCTKCRDKNFLIECNCGCGRALTRVNKWGNLRKNGCLQGHYRRPPRLSKEEHGRRFYKRHREKVIARMREYRKEHHDEILARARRRYALDPQKVNEANKESYRRNRATALASVAKYRELHRDETVTIGPYIIGHGKRVRLSFNPRRRTCSICGMKVKAGVRNTHMHHVLGYITIFPWFGMKELCDSCHQKEHEKEKRREGVG